MGSDVETGHHLVFELDRNDGNGPEPFRSDPFCRARLQIRVLGKYGLSLYYHLVVIRFLAVVRSMFDDLFSKSGVVFKAKGPGAGIMQVNSAAVELGQLDGRYHKEPEKIFKLDVEAQGDPQLLLDVEQYLRLS